MEGMKMLKINNELYDPKKDTEPWEGPRSLAIAQRFWEDRKDVKDWNEWNEWMRVVEQEDDEPTVLQQVALGVLMVAVLFLFLILGEAYWGV
jgi:hypothetical protein